MRTAPLLLLAFAMAPPVAAQIDPVGSTDNVLLVVRSLPAAGVKLYAESGTGISLYDLDLTPYATITYPDLPEGVDIFAPLIFTENSFDNDPSTIEVMLLTLDQAGVRGTVVIRQDGTVLFQDLQFAFSGVGGYSELNAKPPLFMGEDGNAYMVLTNYPVPPGITAPIQSKLFRLPGQLPCMECFSEGVNVGLNEVGGAPAALLVHPNPTPDQVTVRHTLPHGTMDAYLHVTDTSGRTVFQGPLAPGDRTTVDLTSEANGTYLFSLVQGGITLATRTIVVAR